MRLLWVQHSPPPSDPHLQVLNLGRAEETAKAKATGDCSEVSVPGHTLAATRSATLAVLSELWTHSRLG